MATAHTYYLASTGQCLGELSQREDLCAELRRVWTELAGPGARGGPFDGCSVWIGDDGAMVACFIRDAKAARIVELDLLGPLARLLGAP